MQTYQILTRTALPSILVATTLLIIGSATANEPIRATSGIGQPLTAAGAQTSGAVSEATLRRGNILFLQCRSCHSTESGGEHKVGPNLHGLIGSAAASKEAFNYSEALQTADIVWTEQTLNEFLKGPNDLVAGTIMAFPGIPEEADRQALIAFLISRTN